MHKLGRLVDIEEVARGLDQQLPHGGGSFFDSVQPAGIFFQRYMRPSAFKKDPDEALVAKIIDKDLPPILDYLETVVPATDYIFGELQLADISLVSPFINAGYANYTVDAQRWPKLAAYVDRVKAHPIMEPILKSEAKIMGFA